MEAEAPEKEKFPQEWKKKDALQRLCMMRALRADRMTYAVNGFIEEKLGAKFVESRSVEFSKSFEESGEEISIFYTRILNGKIYVRSTFPGTSLEEHLL